MCPKNKICRLFEIRPREVNMGFPRPTQIFRKLDTSNIIFWLLKEKARRRSLSYSKIIAIIFKFLTNIGHLCNFKGTSADFEQILRSDPQFHPKCGTK
jgi:hypothetical protein